MLWFSASHRATPSESFVWQKLFPARSFFGAERLPLPRPPAECRADGSEHKGAAIILVMHASTRSNAIAAQLVRPSSIPDYFCRRTMLRFPFHVSILHRPLRCFRLASLRALEGCKPEAKQRALSLSPIRSPVNPPMRNLFLDFHR